MRTKQYVQNSSLVESARQGPRLRLFDLETCFREGLPDPTQRPFDHGAALTLALDAEDAVKATVMEALETGADVVRVHPVPSCALTDGNAGLAERKTASAS